MHTSAQPCLCWAMDHLPSAPIISSQKTWTFPLSLLDISIALFWHGSCFYITLRTTLIQYLESELATIGGTAWNRDRAY